MKITLRWSQASELLLVMRAALLLASTYDGLRVQWSESTEGTFVLTDDAEARVGPNYIEPVNFNSARSSPRDGCESRHYDT